MTRTGMRGFLSSLNNIKGRPWAVAALLTVKFCSGEMIVTLRAVGPPRFQQGGYTSAGRELAPGITAGFPF